MKYYIYIILAFTLILLSISSCRMYSKLPKVSILTSKGILFDNETFFLIHYRIFKKPEGIMKFPDGGLPKDLIDEYYIVKYQNNYNGDPKGNKLVYKINSEYGRIDLKSVEIFEDKGSLYFLIEYKNGKWKKSLFKIDPKTGKTVIRNEKEIINLINDEKNIISHKSTEELLRFIYDYENLGLKNPLDYMKLSDKSIKDVLLHSELNGRIHIALIYYLIKNNKIKLLNEIEKENTDKYIDADIKYFKEGWTIKQLKQYYKSIK